MIHTDRPALLEARGLVKHLGGHRVVDGVDLVCREGEVLGLLGPNRRRQDHDVADAVRLPDS
jgi:ABC-type lipopolysaccharide export system ATPase subunit